MGWYLHIAVSQYQSLPNLGIHVNLGTNTVLVIVWVLAVSAVDACGLYGENHIWSLIQNVKHLNPHQIWQWAVCQNPPPRVNQQNNSSFGEGSSIPCWQIAGLSMDIKIQLDWIVHDNLRHPRCMMGESWITDDDSSKHPHPWLFILIHDNQRVFKDDSTILYWLLPGDD